MSESFFLNLEFKIGDRVKIKLDPENEVYYVTQIMISHNDSIEYMLSNKAGGTWYFGFELEVVE